MDECQGTDDDSPGELSVVLDAPQVYPTLDDASLGEPDLELIRSAVAQTLQRHGQSDGIVSIRLVDDETMSDLHERSMGISGPTDVLTFDLSENETDTTAPKIEGDVVISIDTARREAQARNHPLVHELMLYAIHATLHLLGFDDHSEIDATRMHTEEDAIMVAMGIGPVYGRPSG